MTRPQTVSVPLRGGRLVPVEESWVEGWAELYGDRIWVRRQIRDAVSYLHDNPRKRPEKSARSYLGNWLRREVKQFGRGPDPAVVPTPQATLPIERPRPDEDARKFRAALLYQLGRWVARGNLDTWFEPMRVVDLAPPRVVISWPNEMFTESVQQRWANEVQSGCAELGCTHVAYTTDAAHGGGTCAASAPPV